MDIAQILKDKPKGYPLYSPLFGECYFNFVSVDKGIVITTPQSHNTWSFNSDGTIYKEGECMLFPSKDNRDWNTVDKFDIKSLQPFDRVLVRNDEDDRWSVSLFGYHHNDSIYRFSCIDCYYKQCIPYNNDTKHLVGTIDNCPNYYKNW